MNFRATYEFKLHVAGVSTKYFSTNVHNDISVNPPGVCCVDFGHTYFWTLSNTLVCKAGVGSLILKAKGPPPHPRCILKYEAVGNAWMP